MNYRKALRAASRALLYLSRKRSPLLRDPQYAGLCALEADMRSKHMNASSVRKAKQDRLHDLLRVG